jgi:hypothetical protein
VVRGALIGTVLVAVMATVVTLLILAAARRWQSGQARAKPTFGQWQQQLNELHYLLLQVTASDSTLTALPGLSIDVSNDLRAYFGGHKVAPSVPDRQLVQRVMLLEDWLLAVHAASSRSVLSPLPPPLVERIGAYVEERERRLGK